MRANSYSVRQVVLARPLDAFNSAMAFARRRPGTVLAPN